MSETRGRIESDAALQARVLKELKPITVFTVVTTVLLLVLYFIL